MFFPLRHRLSFFLTLVLIIAIRAGSASTTQTSLTRPAENQPPNIVLILADDMDYADVALYGGKLTRTPHIDSIASNGVQFTDAYMSCPVCGPSRVGILTGRYQDRIGYVTNHGPKIPENFGLPSSEILLPETLKGAGYATGMVGKWHLGFKPDMVPNAQGFDYFYGHLHGSHDYRPSVEDPGPILRNKTPVKTTQYLTREFGDEAARFIDRHTTVPYFLFVPFNAVHGPLQAPEETLEKFAHIKNQRDRTMAAMVYELDMAVGKILEAVKRSGKNENTIVIFTNDNGGVRGELPESNGKFRGGKASLYEGGIRVPMFIQWPRRITHGTVYTSPVISLDLAPTLASAAQATSTVAYEGVDLLPYLNKTKTGAPHDELFWHFVDAPSQKAVRKNYWKAIQPADGAPWELYDLSKDAGEIHNVADEHESTVTELRKAWQNWSAHNKAPLFMDTRIEKRRQANKNSHNKTGASSIHKNPEQKKRQ